MTEENIPTILVSGCFAETGYKFDGGVNTDERIVDLIEKGIAIICCPEVDGGLNTPRPPASIEIDKTAADVWDGTGKVLTNDGTDVTEQYKAGAQETLDLCKKNGITVAILKARSPSCGSRQVYQGDFSGTRIDGRGVTAELLIQNGIIVYNEENVPEELFQ